MSIPLGYVGYTVPQDVEFLSNTQYHQNPYYGTELDAFVQHLLSQSPVYGFEFTKSLHNVGAQGTVPFPQNTTVYQHHVLDGLASFRGFGDVPITDNYIEAMCLSGNEAIDPHGYWFLPYGAQLPIVRLEVYSYFEASVFKPRPTCSGERSQRVVLSQDTYNAFNKGVTLAYDAHYIFRLDELDCHELFRNAMTLDPAKGNAVTWKLGYRHWYGDHYGHTTYDGERSRPAMPLQMLKMRQRTGTATTERLINS